MSLLQLVIIKLLSPLKLFTALAKYLKVLAPSKTQYLKTELSMDPSLLLQITSPTGHEYDCLLFTSVNFSEEDQAYKYMEFTLCSIPMGPWQMDSTA